MIDLSMIIVNWNTCRLLAECLEALLADLSSSDAEIWVVDNASTDGSAEMVRARFPQVRLIANHHNAGFACANNQAIAQSQGRTLFLLNPDTRVKTGAVAALLHFMETHPQAGAAGARLLNADGSLQSSCQPAPTLLREAWRLFHLDRLHPIAVYPMARWPLDRPHPVETIQGAALALRREALDEVGLFDERFFIYSEEIDLCYRLRRAGWQLYWLPAATVIHHGAQSTRQAATPMFLHLYQGKLRYFRKHHGRWAGRAYQLILLAAALSRLLLAPLAWLAPPSQRTEYLALAGRYRRLLLALPRM